MFLRLHPSRVSVGSRSYQAAVYLCPACKQEVVRRRHHGERQKTCGCLGVSYQLAEQREKGNLKHGVHRHPLYAVWSSMCFRCENPRYRGFARYGGRGIKVCEEWRTNPAAFIEWAQANGWRAGLTLDRRDNDDGYHPANCRFVTAEVNGQNRSSVKITFETARAVVAQLMASIPDRAVARDLGISLRIVRDIRRRRTWKNAWPDSYTQGLRSVSRRTPRERCASNS